MREKEKRGNNEQEKPKCEQKWSHAEEGFFKQQFNYVVFSTLGWIFVIYFFLVWKGLSASARFYTHFLTTLRLFLYINLPKNGYCSINFIAISKRAVTIKKKLNILMKKYKRKLFRTMLLCCLHSPGNNQFCPFFIPLNFSICFSDSSI